MASNSTTISRSGYQVNDFTLYVSAVENSVDSANNTSSVTLIARLISTTSSTAWNSNSNTPYLQLFNGSTQVGSNLMISTMGAGETKEIKQTVTISHAADGTKTITAKAKFVKPSANTNRAVPSSGEVTVNLALTSITTKATLTISASTYTVSSTSGDAITLTYTVPTGATCTAVASCGSNSVTLSNKKITNAQLLQLVPTSSGIVTFALTTTKSGTTVGTDTKNCTVTISTGSIKPSVTMGTITLNSGGVSSKFVGGRSTAYVNVTGTNSTGSTGITIKVTSNRGETISPSSSTTAGSAVKFTTGTLKNPNGASSWSLTLTATVTDSRGATATTSKSVTVYEYSTPTITSLAAKRCDQDGTLNNFGEYVKVTSIEFAYSGIGGSNSCSITSSTYTRSDSTTGTISGSTPFALAIDKRATITYVVTDTVGNTDTKTITVNTITVPLDLYSNSTGGTVGVGIGTFAKSGRCDIALNTYLTGGLVGTYIYTGSKTSTSDENNGSLLNSQGQLYLFGDTDHSPALAFRSSTDGGNNIGYVNASTSTGNVAINSTSGNVELRTAGTSKLTVLSGGAVRTYGNIFSGGKTAYNDNHVGNELTHHGRLYMCGTATDVPGFYFDHIDPNPDPNNPTSVRQGGLWVYAKNNATYAPATNNSAVLTTNMAINATYGIFWDKCPVARSKTTNNVVFEWVNNRIKVYIDTTMVGYMTLASS